MNSLAPFVVAALAASLASAQGIARFAPAVPDGTGVLELSFVRERAGRSELQPWPAREIGWLFVREEGTQRNYDSLVLRPGDETRLRVECAGAGEKTGQGAALIGWDPPPRVEWTSPDDLRAFLAERAATLPPELAALPPGEPVPVLRLESLALITRGATPAEPSGIAISKSGQRMEFRALMDPSFLAAGSDFAFKLYAPVGGTASLHVRAVLLDAGAAGPEQRHAHTLARLPDGSVRAQLDRPGAWVLEAIRVRPLDATAGAVLELASASLVFTVRPAPASEEKGGGR